MHTAPRPYSPCRAALLGLVLFAGTAAAQDFDLAGATNNRGFHQPSGRRNMVAYDNNLYAAVVQQNGAVEIRRKADDVLGAWSTVVTVNDATTGIGATDPTTTVAMALTRAGALHVTWGRYVYPTFFRQYYRCYRIGIGFTHAPQDVTALVGATSTTRSDSMAVATGPGDEVFLTAQDGTASWRTRLLQSAWTGFPGGVAPAWTNRGQISANGASSSNVQMAVDAAGNVQLAFYNNTGNGQYATRVFTPPTTWSAQEQIGVPPVPRDDAGYLATDHSRFTHVLYKHLVSQTGSLVTYELLYRRRMGTLPWSAPIVVDTFTNLDHGTDNPRDGYALAATTKGERVFAIYRNHQCKRFMVKQKKITDPTFELLAELQVPSTLPNDYYMPSVRSTLFPWNNSLYDFLDISFRRPSGTTFELVHQRLHVSQMDVDKPGCNGTCGVPAITYGGVPKSPLPHTVKFGLERAKPGSPAFLLWTLSDSLVIPFASCSLYANNILTTQMVDTCCHAEFSIPLPSILGITLYNQWAVLDSGALGGWALSNRGVLGL